MKDDDKRQTTRERESERDRLKLLLLPCAAVRLVGDVVAPSLLGPTTLTRPRARDVDPHEPAGTDKPPPPLAVNACEDLYILQTAVPDNLLVP